ncbi:2300_t:CDS:1, partial [Acaulospora colombiana]
KVSCKELARTHLLLVLRTWGDAVLASALGRDLHCILSLADTKHVWVWINDCPSSTRYPIRTWTSLRRRLNGSDENGNGVQGKAPCTRDSETSFKNRWFSTCDSVQERHPPSSMRRGSCPFPAPYARLNADKLPTSP